MVETYCKILALSYDKVKVFLHILMLWTNFNNGNIKLSGIICKAPGSAGNMISIVVAK